MKTEEQIDLHDNMRLERSYTRTEPKSYWFIVHRVGSKPNLVIVHSNSAQRGHVSQMTDMWIAINFDQPETGSVEMVWGED